MDNVLSLIKIIHDFSGTSPCKKTVQKIVYLIQEANEDLGFEYSIHFYGPYSAELDSEIRHLFNCGDLKIDKIDYGHMLSVNDSSNISPMNKTADNVISKFSAKSPSDLELLATTLYVQREIPDSHIESIVAGVMKIKGTKYSKHQIEMAIQELVDNDYFEG